MLGNLWCIDKLLLHRIFKFSNFKLTQH